MAICKLLRTQQKGCIRAQNGQGKLKLRWVTHTGRSAKRAGRRAKVDACRLRSVRPGCRAWRGCEGGRNKYSSSRAKVKRSSGARESIGQCLVDWLNDAEKPEGERSIPQVGTSRTLTRTSETTSREKISWRRLGRRAHWTTQNGRRAKLQSAGAYGRLVRPTQAQRAFHSRSISEQVPQTIMLRSRYCRHARQCSESSARRVGVQKTSCVFQQAN